MAEAINEKSMAGTRNSSGRSGDGSWGGNQVCERANEGMGLLGEEAEGGRGGGREWNHQQQWWGGKGSS